MTKNVNWYMDVPNIQYLSTPKSGDGVVPRRRPAQGKQTPGRNRAEQIPSSLRPWEGHRTGWSWPWGVPVNLNYN
jgi:hypothetical protein